MAEKPVSEQIYRSDLLTGRRALVTGASRGIGRQCVLSLAACGAEVTALARNKTELLSLCKEAGPRVRACPADANAEDFISRLEDLPPLDILVNNLGTNQPQSFVDVTDEALQTMLNLNFISLFKITQQVVRVMLALKSKGSIINIGSQMGHVGAPDRTVYCATKHALEGFTRALAVELAPKGIRVNSVAPTFIETPLTKPMFENEEFRQSVLERIPIGKIGSVHDVANAVVYLASDAAAMITGASLRVDGGWTAQ